jgi:hypothetical protein
MVNHQEQLQCPALIGQVTQVRKNARSEAHLQMRPAQWLSEYCQVREDDHLWGEKSDYTIKSC